MAKAKRINKRKLKSRQFREKARKYYRSTIFIFFSIMAAIITAVLGAPANANRTCPLLIGRLEEGLNLTTDIFGIGGSDDPEMHEDEEATDDVIALRTNPPQSDDYSFLYEYLTGVGVHNFNDTITIGFLGAYGQTQVSRNILHRVVGR